MAGEEEKALKSIILKLAIGGIFIIAVPLLIGMLTGVDLNQGCVTYGVITTDPAATDAEKALCINDTTLSTKKEIAGTGLNNKIVSTINEFAPLMKWGMVAYVLIFAAAMLIGPGKDAYKYMKEGKID